MTLRTTLVGGSIALVALVALAIAALWFFVLDNDAPPPVSLDDAVSSAGMAPGPDAAMAPDSAPEDGVLAGEWTVVRGEPTFAGYRIDQQVAGIGAETVVSRTPNVDGSLTFEGTTLTQTEVTVDMTSLKSDESLRDNVLEGQAIETGDFPTSEFVLTQPVDVGAGLFAGESIRQTVAGELTLHGVTRPVQVEVEAAMDSGRLVIVGSADVVLGDFEIDPPRGPASVLSVDDHGVFEVQLVFEHAV